MNTPCPSFRYAIISDTHLRPKSESSSPWATNLQTNSRANWIVDQVNKHEPDLVIHLGDIIHPVPHQPSYTAAAEVARQVFGELDAPIHYVPGNHDIGDKHNPNVPAYPVDAHGLKVYASAFGPRYSSFDHGGVHFVLINSSVINSGLPEEAEQRRWLEKDLDENQGKRIHLFSHYPPYIVEPWEASNYDNVDEPGRSWLLGLLSEHNVEAMFAGHVHQFGYNAYAGTRIYNLLSTCFVRQDYSELFRVEAADEYGRNDAAKLGYATVDVHEGGHRLRVVRSYGAVEAAPGKMLERSWGISDLKTTLGVHVRHPLAEVLTLPYNGPIDEFTRKKVRNEYPVLGLWETGLKALRLPLTDLAEPATAKRVGELAEFGHVFDFFTVGPPSGELLEALSQHRGLVDMLEIIVPWEKAVDYYPKIMEVRDTIEKPVYLANIETSVHREKGGPKFSHYISHGFHIDDTRPLDAVLDQLGGVDGYVFQVSQGASPLSSVKAISGYAERNGFKALINVKLSSDNPAEYLRDDNYVANMAAESVMAACVAPNVTVFLDTFMDIDRGYFPRTGLYDRRYNPRLGSAVLGNLQEVLFGETGVKHAGTRLGVDWVIHEFETERSLLSLVLPMRPSASADIPGDLGKGKRINLDTGMVGSPPRQGARFMIFQAK